MIQHAIVALIVMAAAVYGLLQWGPRTLRLPLRQALARMTGRAGGTDAAASAGCHDDGCGSCSGCDTGSSNSAPATRAERPIRLHRPARP